MLSSKQQKQYARFYLFCYMGNYAWLFFNGLLFSQNSPVLFVNSLDISLNILMLTNLHKLISADLGLQIFFDLLYLIMPAILVYAVIFDKKIKSILALTVSIFSLIYGLLYTAFSYFHMDYFLPCILIPLLFFPVSEKGFYYMLHCIRYIFLAVFFSSAIWKIRAGGIFNTDQMSAILLQQHKHMLVSDPSYYFLRIIYFFINNPLISYLFYFMAWLSQFLFSVGFFTKRFDRVLLCLLSLFIIADFLLMRINYFNWVVFTGLFYFSRFRIREPNTPIH